MCPSQPALPATHSLCPCDKTHEELLLDAENACSALCSIVMCHTLDMAYYLLVAWKQFLQRYDCHSTLLGEVGA